jgi:hypothetical protein
MSVTITLTHAIAPQVIMKNFMMTGYRAELVDLQTIRLVGPYAEFDEMSVFEVAFDLQHDTAEVLEMAEALEEAAFADQSNSTILWAEKLRNFAEDPFQTYMGIDEDDM